MKRYVLYRFSSPGYVIIDRLLQLQTNEHECLKDCTSWEKLEPWPLYRKLLYGDFRSIDSAKYVESDFPFTIDHYPELFI